MSGLFRKKEKLHRELVRWKKELKLAPGYSILTLWTLFTLALLGWALMTSLSTTKEIFSNKPLENGFHMENYTKTRVNPDVSTIFFSSLLYVAVPCTLLILICAPAAHTLSRFDFVCSKLIQSSLAASMGAPAIMIVLPLSAVMVGLSVLNSVSANRATLIFLYIGVNVPYTTILLTTFLANLSRAFEEVVAIDGCPPVKTFQLIILPVAQPGIVTVTVFSFINIWNEHFVSLIFGNSDKVRPVAVGLYPMTSSTKYTGDWVGMFSAVAIMFLPAFTLYVFLSGKVIAGVTEGGMKGQDEMESVGEQRYTI